MINYTTPKISLVVEGIDISAFDVYVTLQQACHEITKKGDDLTVSTTTVGQVTDTNIQFRLTQEESAMFNMGKGVAVQVNWITEQGIRGATEIKAIGVMRNLLDEVIAYGD